MRVETIEDYAKINRYHLTMLPYFARQAARTRPTATATCSITRWCSTAARWATPTCTATSACRWCCSARPAGRCKGNLHVQCKDETPHANVLLTLLHKLGVDQASIGDSTGEVAI